MHSENDDDGLCVHNVDDDGAEDDDYDDDDDDDGGGVGGGGGDYANDVVAQDHIGALGHYRKYLR